MVTCVVAYVVACVVAHVVAYVVAYLVACVVACVRWGAVQHGPIGDEASSIGEVQCEVVGLEAVAEKHAAFRLSRTFRLSPTNFGYCQHFG